MFLREAYYVHIHLCTSILVYYVRAILYNAAQLL
jgi:hypothetical protein